ncbi:MAG: hypothetical protein R6X10_10005 [Desulfobacterales bacterium]
MMERNFAMGLKAFTPPFVHFNYFYLPLGVDGLPQLFRQVIQCKTVHAGSVLDRMNRFGQISAAKHFFMLSNTHR